MTIKNRIQALENKRPQVNRPDWATEQADGSYLVKYPNGQKVATKDAPNGCKIYGVGVNPDDWDK